MEKIREVYSLLMPLQGARVVLPRAAVAEVTGYSRPKNRPDDAPDFLLGFIDWQGQQIPLVSFELACGREAPEQGRRARIAVVFGIAGRLDPNAFAVLTQGYPYLVRVNEGVLKQEDLTEQDQQGPVLARVRMANERPLIPDIETLEAMLADALGERAKAPEPSITEPAADELDQLDVGGEDDFESGLLDEGSTAAKASDMASELESLVQESQDDLAEIAEVAGGDEDTDYADGVTTADLDLPAEDPAMEGSGETDYSGELAQLDEALEDESTADVDTDKGSDEASGHGGNESEFGIETGEIGDIEFSEGSGETDYSGELDDISGALEDTQHGDDQSESDSEDAEGKPDSKEDAEDGEKGDDGDQEADEKEEFSLEDIEFDLDDDEESPDKED